MFNPETAFRMLAPNDVLWAKLKDAAIIPTKNDEDAGFDLYAADRTHMVMIPPHATVQIHTGLCSAFHESKVGILCERSSTGAKGIGQRSGVYDSGYRGEWIVPITNHNDKMLCLTPNPDFAPDECIVHDLNKAICQVVFLDIPKLNTMEVTPDEIQGIPSKRGNGRLGSSEK